LTVGSRSNPSPLQRLRALCLALPETSETSSWGHPNFRAGRRTFVAYERVGGRPSIAFRVGRSDAGRLQQKGRFFATPYGRGIWASTWADGPLDWKLVADLVRRSYRGVALRRMIDALERPASRD
jgi:predicted DNA-binding protein (MmcQ/YjbR family)